MEIEIESILTNKSLKFRTATLCLAKMNVVEEEKIYNGKI